MEITHKSYKDLESLKEYPVPQGQIVTIVFPSSFPKEYIDEWKKDNGKLKPGCGCTSFSIQEELEQITFKVKAPEFNHKLDAPYLKSVMPTFKSELGDIIKWDIKFYVKEEK